MEVRILNRGELEQLPFFNSGRFETYKSAFANALGSVGMQFCTQSQWGDGFQSLWLSDGSCRFTSWPLGDRTFAYRNSTWSDPNYRKQNYNARNIGIRPVLQYSDVADSCINEQYIEDGVYKVEFGEYPQTAASRSMCEALEYMYRKDLLTKTGKTYTIDSKRQNVSGEDWIARTYPETLDEYIYKDKRYVRVHTRKNISISSRFEHWWLDIDEPIWCEVRPIRWYVHKREDLMLAMSILIGGIQFNDKKYDGVFQDTMCYKYLNTYFVKDIMPSTLSMQDLKAEDGCLRNVRIRK